MQQPVFFEGSNINCMVQANSCKHACCSDGQKFSPLMKLLGSSYSDPTLDSTLSQFNLMYTHTQNFSDFTIMTIATHKHTKSTKLPPSLYARLVTLSDGGSKTKVSETYSVATFRTGHDFETLGRLLASLIARDQFRNLFFLQKLTVFRSLYVRAFPDVVRKPHTKTIPLLFLQKQTCMKY